jgi:hypothetical protein
VEDSTICRLFAVPYCRLNSPAVSQGGKALFLSTVANLSAMELLLRELFRKRVIC